MKHVATIATGGAAAFVAKLDLGRQMLRSRAVLYTDLSYREKLVADAFWKRFLAAYPGLGQLKIDDAVKGRASSWVVGRSRGICQNAKLAVVALDNL